MDQESKSNKQQIDWEKIRIERQQIKLAIINSGLINEDGWISTGTESSDFSDEFEQAVNKLNDIISNSLDQNNKAWLKRVEGLRLTVDEINSRWEDPEYVWENYDKLVEFTKGIIKDFNTSVDNLVKSLRRGKNERLCLKTKSLWQDN